ncbi:MAG: NAD(P)H-binding protein [Longimicrobiales bacterium]
MNTQVGTTLVIGGRGKTGGRVASRLARRGDQVRTASRSSEPPFDWLDQATWRRALEGADSLYVTFQPDLAIPVAPDAIRALTALALELGVRHMVLLSGRGEPEAQHCEDILRDSGVPWTILRCSWFAQNFSESFFLDGLIDGHLVLPASDIGEPFIDVEDIADAAVTTLTEDGHVGQLYELTGPRLLSFADAVAEIARAAGRVIRFSQVAADEHAAALAAHQVPADVIALVTYLFSEVLDGRNAWVNDGVQQVLGRPARDFSDYVRKTAATGVWSVLSQAVGLEAR